MSWILAVLLAAGCFAAFAFVFRLPRKGWAMVLACLALGLAGYAFQASPGFKGAPKRAQAEFTDEGGRIVELRKELAGEDASMPASLVITADAMMRHGQSANAATLLRGAVERDPKDGEAWLALANALTFHADGALTPPALFAYRRAAEAAPKSAGPSFFVGLALIRQGRLLEGRELWAQQLASMPEGASGRDALAKRLADLDELLRKIAESTQDSGR